MNKETAELYGYWEEHRTKNALQTKSFWMKSERKNVMKHF